MSRLITYPRSVKITEKDGTVVNILTQQYQVGLYVALYIGKDPIPQQYNMSPATFSKNIKKDIKKAEERGAEVVIGSDISVREVDGLWQVQEKEAV